MKKLFGSNKVNPNLTSRNSYTFKKITDKNVFLAAIIFYAPDHSVWHIEGLHQEDVFKLVSPYIIKDNMRISEAVLWPKQEIIKILLTPESKKDIIGAISDWNLESDFYHQYIYKDDVFLLMAHDCIDIRCTWLNKDFNKSVLLELKTIGVIDFVD